jgi:hypothetical protein
VDIVLSPKGKLVGFVKDEAGTPVEGATVDFWSAPQVVTDKDGKFIVDMPGQRDSRYTDQSKSKVQKEGYLYIDFYHPSPVFRGAFGSLTLHKAEVFTFRVVDDKGQPLEGVEITSRGVFRPLEPASGKTDTDGKLRGSVVSYFYAREQSDTIDFLLSKEGWIPRWVTVDMTKDTENLEWSLEPCKPNKDVRVHFSFEGEDELPVIAQVVGYLKAPQIANLQNIEDWRGITRDEDGAILLKNIPDCEARYFFVVMSVVIMNDGTSKINGEGMVYSATIKPNDDGEIVKVVVKRSPDQPKIRNNPNDYWLTTPFGQISYRAAE